MEFILSIPLDEERQPSSRPGAVDNSIGPLLSSSLYDDTFLQPGLDVSYQQKRPSTGNTQGFSNPSYGKRTKFEETGSSESAAAEVPDLLAIEKTAEVERFSDVLSSNELNSSTGSSSSALQSGYEPIESCSDYLRNCSSRRTISGPSHFQSQSSTGGNASQGHSFVTKTAPLNERCYSCDKVFVPCKRALKCDNCRMMCHPHCKDKCPTSCIHWTPCSPKGPKSTISDYTSSASSMIPSLIIHCVDEIESRGLKEIGLYAIPADGKEVKEVKEKLLKGKSLIKLNKTDVHDLCGVIMSFLRSLKEPLIPRSAWKSFQKASELKDKNTSLYLLYNLVCDLPQPNQKTLAFLLQHFQRVSKSTDCLMTVEHLARVLSATIVGNSGPDISSAKMMQELFQQRTILKRLLMLPSVCWPVILDRQLSANSQKFSVLAAIKASESSTASKSSRNEPVCSTVQEDNLPLARYATVGLERCSLRRP